MRTLIITWCESMSGNTLEEIQDISNLPEKLENLSFEKLQGVSKEEQTKIPQDNCVFYSLRARFNSHRTYYRYGISMPNNVTDNIILNNFDGFVETIKSRGINLYL